MTAQEFVKNVSQEVFKDTYNYYLETLPTPVVGTDKYWENSKALYHSQLEIGRASCRERV